MEFVAGGLNGVLLRNTLDAAIGKCTRVRAAVAYASNDNLRLFNACLFNRKPLEYYGRYDETVPVHPDVLKWFLDRPLAPVSCFLVPDLLHAKVIWWVGHGAYIGSANLSDRAWETNIEAGMYLTQVELESSQMDAQLTFFFRTMQDVSIRLSQDIYLEQRQLASKNAPLDKARYKAQEDFRKSRTLPALTPFKSLDGPTGQDADYISFQKDWYNTIELMAGIAGRVGAAAGRPAWIRPEVKAGAVATRFLNAYYTNFVMEGGSSHFEERHEENQADPAAALDKAIEWWNTGDFDHGYEEVVLNEWSIRHVELLNRRRVAQMTKSEFVEVFQHVHSVREYANRQKAVELGLPVGNAPTDKRAERWAEMLWTQQTEDGRLVLDVLRYVLWGDGLDPRRVWNACYTTDWKISGLGISAWSEVLGWARPDELVPRNTRTSMALYGLGFQVAIL